MRSINHGTWLHTVVPIKINHGPGFARSSDQNKPRTQHLDSHSRAVRSTLFSEASHSGRLSPKKLQGRPAHGKEGASIWSQKRRRVKFGCCFLLPMSPVVLVKVHRMTNMDVVLSCSCRVVRTHMDYTVALLYFSFRKQLYALCSSALFLRRSGSVLCSLLVLCDSLPDRDSSVLWTVTSDSSR